MKSPHHRPSVPPVVAMVEAGNVMPAARAIFARMENIWAVHKCQAWLFLDACRRARVLHDNQMSLPRWQRLYPFDLVGCYNRAGGLNEYRVADDLRAHIAEQVMAAQSCAPRCRRGLIVPQNEATSAI